MAIFRREPALIIGAVQAFIVLAVAFGLNLSMEQTGAILTAVTAVLAVVTRQSVVAPANVVSLYRETAHGGPNEPGRPAPPLGR